MKKFNIRLSHSDLIEAKDAEEAVKKYFESNVECAQQTASTFIQENLEVQEGFLASELSGDALQSVLEKHGEINIDHKWWEMDETPELDMKELGFEIDTNKMSWDLEPRYRQLYFLSDGIQIENYTILLKKLKKDLKLSKDIVEAIEAGKIEFYFDTRHYGGNSGRTLFGINDYTDKSITDNIKGTNIDEALQEWFDFNVVEHLLKYYKSQYDYLMSEEAMIETLDANELLFTKDGKSL